MLLLVTASKVRRAEPPLEKNKDESKKTQRLYKINWFHTRAKQQSDIRGRTSK